MMICPKCGFEQPESPDCMRCGIVIARYKGGPGTPAIPPPPVAAGPPVGGGTFYTPPPARRAAPVQAPFAPAGPSGLDFAPAAAAPAAEPVTRPGGETLFDPMAPVQAKTKSTRKLLLQPLHSSQLLGEALTIFGSNALSFTLLSGLALTPSLLAEAYVSAQKVDTPQQAIQMGLVVILISLVGGPLATGAMTYGVFKQMRGEDTTFGACLGVGLASIGRVLLVSLVQVAALALGLILCFFPYLFVISTYAVAVPAAVEEKLGPFEAMGRSALLTKGYRWPVWRTLFFLGGLQIALSLGAKLFIVRIFAAPQAETLVRTLLNIVLTALSATAMTVIYYRLRATQESIDVDQISSVFD